MEQTDPPLSACIITLNEEEHIERCLNSVSWAAEMVVVDSGSKDETVDIAEEMGARVIHNEWPGHVKQKQFATDRAENDWILSLDADEKVSVELKESILNLFEEENQDPDTTYAVRRLSKYLGKWQHHGSWFPDKKIRLFHRKKTEWGGTDPHDLVLPLENTETLDGVLYHYPYRDLSDHLEYINNYTNIMAEEKVNKGESGGVLRGTTHATFKFFRDYVLKRGFLDGKTGLVNAVMGSYYTFLKYVKTWEKTRDNEDMKEKD